MLRGDIKTLPATLSRLGRGALAAAGIFAVATMLTACGEHKSNSNAFVDVQTSAGSSSMKALDGYQLTITNASSGNALTLTGDDEDDYQENSIDLTTATSDDSTVQRWHLIRMASHLYKLENMLSHQLVGVHWMYTTAGAAIEQYPDNGTVDHEWLFYKQSDGNYKIKNYNSGLYLTSDGAGTLTQEEEEDSTLQEWTITETSDLAYPMPLTVSGEGIYVHDPMMLDVDGTYYLYGTHNTLATSTDLSTFTSNDNGVFGEDFDWWANENTTGTDSRTDLWAPDVLAYDGTYYQYYSIPIYETPSDSSTNEGAEAVIALATSSTPYGGDDGTDWTDAGVVIWSCGTLSGCSETDSSGNSYDYNAIDPHPYVDADGNWYVNFGSWESGILTIPVQNSGDEMGLPTSYVASASFDINGDLSALLDQVTLIAARPTYGEEGAVVFPYVFNGTQYYYYFASADVCCDGTDSTYHILVGRSTSPTGPFYDRSGLALTSAGGNILLSTHGTIVGPGGQSVMATDGDPLLVYHYYDGANAGTPTLGLNYLEFDDEGWPYVSDKTVDDE